MTSSSLAALREADSICSDANAFFAELKQLVEQCVVLWARILFLKTGLNTQFKTLETLSATVIQLAVSASDACALRIAALNTHRSRLEALLLELNNVNVHPALGGGSLGVFIHQESVSAINQHTQNMLISLKEQQSELSKVPKQLSSQLSILKRSRPNLPAVIENDSPKKLAKLSSRAGSVARNVTGILIELTAKYDETESLADNEDANDAQKQKLNELSELRSELRQRNKESYGLRHSLSATLDQFLEFHGHLDTFITESAQRTLREVESLNRECETILASSDPVIAELKALTEYYVLFRESYDALLAESTRRLQAEKRLGKFISSVNKSLHQFQEREHDLRTAFNSKHSEFLPPQLLDLLASSPPLFSIQFESENHPEIE
ncbi:hypothetical protein DASB73_012970 [Starmerella bacillaris]|uniref:Autophagy-related protein 17 n=1 Tax=Starmerella bacillaris TaxID=1247836 RepID=A0AAV5RFS1_STABA|nr:hypothetical protein DASB73_012970 [Starmerella bacillaris]